MTPYRILSLDGGGIRGVLTATLLKRLEEQSPGMLERVNLFAGTSTGGLLALALACELPPKTLIDFYVDQGPRVFKRSIWARFGDLFGLTGAKYGLEGLTEVVQEIFGDRTLGDLSRGVCITAMDLDNEKAIGRQWKPKMFTNLPGIGTDRRCSVVDVAIATAAAPTYFPSWKGYIDGGVFGTNPEMIALAQAFDERCGVPYQTRQLDEVIVLSIGTGRTMKYIEGQQLDWGIAQWKDKILPLIFEGTGDIAAFVLDRFLAGLHCRLNPVLDRKVDMDDIKEVDYLIKVGEQTDLWPVIRWLDEFWGGKYVA